MDSLKQQFLIVENNYLIAIDAQRILAESFECEIDIISSNVLENLRELGAYAIVLLDTSGSEAVDSSRAGAIVESGCGLVFLNAYNDLAKGVAGYCEWPVVTKPFVRETLVDAVEKARARMELPSQIAVAKSPAAEV